MSNTRRKSPIRKDRMWEENRKAGRTGKSTHHKMTRSEVKKLVVIEGGLR